MKRVASKTTQDTAGSGRFRSALSVTLVVGLALAAWEIMVRVNEVPVYLLPAPSVIARALLTGAGYYVRATLVTLTEAMGGLALGIAVGAAVAVLITFWASLERGILALAILIKATPIVAIAPLLIIWFGFGPLPKVIIIALMTFFPVLINVHAGLHDVDPAVQALFHSLNASPGEVFHHARWPSALPYLFAALKVVAPLSLVGAVVAEWAGASSGLGRAMWLAYTNLDMPSLFAAVFCSALMGIALYGIVIGLEERVIFWD
jgi:ABC-type nitrate/sulfonate/bicarbonate transport system permease component